MTPALQSLLLKIRQDPAFPQLLKEAVERPQIRRFRPSRAAKDEIERWQYDSGRADQHDVWITMLTGKPVPHDEETLRERSEP